MDNKQVGKLLNTSCQKEATVQHGEKQRKNPGRRKCSCQDSFTTVNILTANLGASKAEWSVLRSDTDSYTVRVMCHLGQTLITLVTVLPSDMSYLQPGR